MATTLRISDSGLYYYVEGTDAWFWLSTAMWSGPVPDSRKLTTLSGFVDLSSATGLHHREYLPFEFWKVGVKSRRLDETGEHDIRVIDYRNAASKLTKK